MSNDWMPGRRADQLAMARNWVTVLRVRGGAWSVEPAELLALETLTETADKALVKVLSSGRNEVATAECRMAFVKLRAAQRNLKARRFFSPPLSAADITSLMLKPRDTSKTAVPPPEGQAEADVSYVGVHLLRLSIRPVAGTVLDKRASYGCRIYWGVLPQGGATVEQAAGLKRYLQRPPVSGEELPHSLFTRRKKEPFDFSAEESGKTAYFCLRYENSKGKPGPWGPIFHAVIP